MSIAILFDGALDIEAAATGAAVATSAAAETHTNVEPRVQDGQPVVTWPGQEARTGSCRAREPAFPKGGWIAGNRTERRLSGNWSAVRSDIVI
jgi:hypothetical protein